MNWYSLQRGWMDNPKFGNEPYTKAMAWCYLIENAAYKPYKKYVGYDVIELNLGELFVSERYLVQAWQWSKKKVRNFIMFLENDNAITVIRDKKGTTIKVVNYMKYQDKYNNDTEEGTTRGPRGDHEGTTRGPKKNKTNKTNKDYSAPKGAEYKSYGGNVLKGEMLDQFNKFMDAFDYRRDKARAAEAFYKLKPDENLFKVIIHGAQCAAKERPELKAKGQTPKMAQGWITAKRWEDFEYTIPANKPSDSPWEKKLTEFKTNRFWNHDDGPKPTTSGFPDGAFNPDCKAPMDLIKKILEVQHANETPRN